MSIRVPRRELASIPLASILCFGSAAAARPLYEATVTVGAQSASTSTNKLPDVPDLFNASAIQDLIPSFNPLTDDFTTMLDLRGLPVELLYDASARELTFRIPGVIPDIVFSEATLEDNLDQLEDWLMGGVDTQTAQQDLLTDVLQALVEQSPVEPVAGNPNSMMSRMTRFDYTLAGEGPFTYGYERLASAPDLTAFGLQYGAANAGAFDVDTLDLPFDHRFNLRDPKWSLLLSIPISATFAGGRTGWSAMGSLGLGFQARPFDWWAITPMLRLGAVGSINVGAASLLYSGTLNSDIHVDLVRAHGSLAGLTLGITNQLGFVETADGIEIGDYKLEYDLTNGVFRNGGYLVGPFGGRFGWKIFGHDARWTGSDLYLEAHEEIGAAVLLLGQVAGESYEALSFNAAYIGDFDTYNGIALQIRGRF